MNPPWKEFDLSALSYPDFLAFFFERPVVGDGNEYDLFRSGIDSFVASDPREIVGYLEAMCRNFAELGRLYSPEQLDQGLWAVFGAGISCERYLFDLTVDRTLRTDCIESMFFPFRDVVVRRTGNIRESFYWMWWDMILRTFGPKPNQYRDGHLVLTSDQEQMIETIFQTLSKILSLDHRGCQWCALHGLGHLYHPMSGGVVQNYLDTHRFELNEEDIQWINACRDNLIL